MLIKQRLSSIVVFLLLMASWAYAGTITVNSVGDATALDNEITLREAIMLSEGTLDFRTLTAAEQAQISPPVGEGITDTINISVSGTMTPNTSLPAITDDGTVIDASSQWSGEWPEGQPGVEILNKTNEEYANGLVISGAANCHIRGLFITDFLDGVLVHNGAQFNKIGGADIGNRNIISGNSGSGVTIAGPGTDNNVVNGNYIGVAADGMTDLGNAYSGVSIHSGPQFNTIGGATDEDRNIISGNDLIGVVIRDPRTSNNVVSGNYIGTNASGTIALGNSWTGIQLANGAHLNTIGGKTPGERNVISGNDIGLTIGEPGTDNNVVFGNYIGTDATGASDLGNLSNGVEIVDGPLSNIIGGTAAGEGNTIAFNGGIGVLVAGLYTDYNRLSGNSMHDNVDMGIELLDGGNDEIRAPGITWASLASDTLTISGGDAGAEATVEVFEADSSELEGQTYLGSLTADGNGVFSGSLSVPDMELSVGDRIVATTTHTDNNTSEFSSSLTVWEEQETRMLSITSAEASPGGQVLVQLSISDVTGMASGDIIIKYDASVITVDEVTATQLLSDILLVPNIEVPGEIGLYMAGTTGLSEGSGALVEIALTVNPDAEAGTETVLSFGEVRIYDEQGMVIPANLEDGIVKITWPGIKGDVNEDGEVRSNDAMMALRIAAGLMIPTKYQQWAADMNDDGKVRANDATSILRRAAGLAAPGRGLIANAGGRITVTLSEAHGVAGERVTVPIEVDNADMLTGGEICIEYDSAVLRAVGVSCAPDALLASNTTESGMLRIAFASANRLNSQKVAEIQFDVVVDAISLLKFRTVELYGPDARLVSSAGVDREFIPWAMSPKRNALLQNFPNPFNPETWIPYQLAQDSEVTISVYNAAGQLIRTLDLGYMEAGSYATKDKSAYWDGSNEAGEPVASGVYFYTLQAGSYRATRKLSIMR
jgi:hypothetical protein